MPEAKANSFRVAFFSHVFYQTTIEIPTFLRNGLLICCDFDAMAGKNGGGT
jgi:hypothetical protein